jgi:translation initiation factor eIF-2B subunit beta
MSRQAMARHVLQGRELFIQKLQSQSITNSHDLALETAAFMRLIISKTYWRTAQQLLQEVVSHGKVLMAAAPHEIVIGNIVFRVMAIIREEYGRILHEKEVAEGNVSQHSLGVFSGSLSFHEQKNTVTEQHALSLYNLLDGPNSSMEVMDRELDVKPDIIECVNELMDDIKESSSEIADFGYSHIQESEIILLLGTSRTILSLLQKAASSVKTLSVLLVLDIPGNPSKEQGEQFAEQMRKSNIAVTIVPLSSVGAVMPKINRVLLSPVAIFANGGLLTMTGTLLVVMAALQSAVPVMACGGVYKLSQRYAMDQVTVNCAVPPQSIYEFPVRPNYDEAHLQVSCSRYDMVPPEMVALLVTNLGCHVPTYMYRLVAENYHPSDRASW